MAFRMARLRRSNHQGVLCGQPSRVRGKCAAMLPAVADRNAPGALPRVATREDNPGDASDWCLHEILWDRLVDVAGDYETHEIDFEAPEVREQLHPLLADEAKTA